MRYSCEVPTKPNETTVTAPLGRWNEDVRVGGQPKMGMQVVRWYGHGMRKKKRGAGRGGLARKEKGGERCIRPEKERERERQDLTEKQSLLPVYLNNER